MELLIFVFIGVGIFAGLSAGLFGVGGGIISVPAMVMILKRFFVLMLLIVALQLLLFSLN